MIPLKDARYILAELQKLSLVETQEVPKFGGKSRNALAAQGEYHLWSVDLPRIYNSLLASVYKTLGNILTRKASEIETRRLVLAREERTVGQGGRARLQAKDQEDLTELDNVMMKTTLAEARTELVAFILRDLPGWRDHNA